MDIRKKKRNAAGAARTFLRWIRYELKEEIRDLIQAEIKEALQAA
jgi:hypothetical protein